jgi:hypothetical protein
MQKVTLEINNSIYDYIMFFLENIPKNLLNIKKELQMKTDIKKESSDSFNPRDFFSIDTNTKAEIDSYIEKNRNEWDKHIDR